MTEHERLLPQFEPSWPIEELKKLGKEYVFLSDHLIQVPDNTAYLQERLPVSSKLVVCVTGFSGGGKNSIVRGLEETGYYQKVRTDTDREMREGETNGIDYRFRSKLMFSLKLARGDYFEHQTYAGNRRGIDRYVVEHVMAQNKIPIFQLDPRGVHTLNHMWRQGTYFQNCAIANYFVMPESEDLLRQRLMRRDGDDGRMSEVSRDLKGLEHSDFIVVNSEGESDKVVAEVCMHIQNLHELMLQVPQKQHIRI